MAAVAAWLGYNAWLRYTTPALPVLDLATADPLVAKAVAEARAQVQQAPRSGAAWGRLGMVLLAHGWYSPAHASFDQAERLEPREPRWPYFNSRALDNIDSDAALAKARRAAELAGDGQETVRLRYAERLLGLDRPDEAVQQFRLLLQKQPDHARAHLGLARREHLRGRLEQSLEHLNRSRLDVHTRKASYLLLATVEQERGNETEAARKASEAAELPPDADWPDPLEVELAQLQTGRSAGQRHAVWLMNQGRGPEAVALLQQLVQRYPQSDTAWLTLGKALLMVNEPAGAETAFRKATELTRESVEAPFQLARALMAQNKYRDAVASLRKAAEIKPEAAQVHFVLGQCLLREGDESGAIAAFRAAVRYKPQFFEAHTELGELFAKKGQNTQARDHLQAALQLNPADAKAKRLLEQMQ